MNAATAARKLTAMSLPELLVACRGGYVPTIASRRAADAPAVESLTAALTAEGLRFWAP